MINVDCIFYGFVVEENTNGLREQTEKSIHDTCDNEPFENTDPIENMSIDIKDEGNFSFISRHEIVYIKFVVFRRPRKSRRNQVEKGSGVHSNAFCWRCIECCHNDF